MAGWARLNALIAQEIIAKREEGYLTDGMAELLEQAGNDKEKLMSLYEKLCSLPFDKSFAYQEPEYRLDEIRALRPKQGQCGQNRRFAPTLNDDELLDTFKGAWLGRAAGCALGKPLEKAPFMGGADGDPGWKYVARWFKGANAWPIANFTPGESKATAQYGIAVGHHCEQSQLHKIRFMESDDDIRYTVLGLKMLEHYGREWNTWNLGKMWHSTLTYAQVCTAETQAYMNFAQVTSHTGRELPEDYEDRLSYVRNYLNPYREWIGAQIRVDAYGYGAAGDPELAAEFAQRDAAFSHTKNGIYGAMFFAAVIAAAFYESDPEKLIAIGLSEIPATCRLAHDIEKAVWLAKNAENAIDLVDGIYNAFGKYNPVHTINNACLCAAALVFAKGDFETAITTAVLGGWDTDCNGATVGSIMGAIYGAAALPEKWIAPFNDTLYSEVVGFHPISFTECAHRTLEVYHSVLTETV